MGEGVKVRHVVQRICLENGSFSNGLGRHLQRALNEDVVSPRVQNRLLKDEHIQALTHACLIGQEQASELISEWLSLGVDIEDIYLEGIVPTAHILGQKWCDDEVDFASVTLVNVCLRQLLLQYSEVFQIKAHQAAKGLSCFIVGEFDGQHTLGSFMLGEFFKRYGWQVRADPCETGGDLLKMMSCDWFDLLVISLTTEAQLHQIRRLLPLVKKISTNSQLKIMAGGPLVQQYPDLMDDLGVVVVTQDAREAQKTALDLVRRPSLVVKHELTALNL